MTITVEDKRCDRVKIMDHNVCSTYLMDFCTATASRGKTCIR